METISKKKLRVPVKNYPKATPVANLKNIAPIIPGVRLESFSVTHDSVVATMNFVVTKDHKSIKIWWGDESQNQQPETVFLGRHQIFQKPILGGDILPENTFKLQHGYDENAPKRKIILVKVQDKKDRISWETAVIDIEPRYTFISYPVIIEGREHLDSFFESDSEFKIDMVVKLNNGILLDKHWELDIKTDDPPFSFKLKESAFKTQIIYSDKPIIFNILITEDDNIFKNFFDVFSEFPIEFDTSNIINNFIFHPRYFKGSQQFRSTFRLDDDGSVDVILNLEMNLIVHFDKVSMPINAIA